MEEVNSHVEVCHGLMKEEYERLSRGPYKDTFSDERLRLQAYEEADCILCPSGFVQASFLEKGFALRRLLLVPYGCMIGTETKAFAAKRRTAFRILFVGQLHFRKGLRYLIEAFERLDHPRKELVLVGPPTGVTGLEDVRLPKNVFLTGALKGPELADQYMNADVFVLPSIEEGLALVQGEALSYGLPLVITTNTGGSELIRDGIEGLIVRPGDAGVIKDALQRLVSEESLLPQMQAAALLRSKELGGWSKTVCLLREKLQSLIPSGAAMQRHGVYL
jgi:glycosyltransferase involved in cell wall biosynthesis